MEAVKKLKGMESKKVFLVVTPLDLKVIDMDTKAIIQESPMTQVVYSGINPEDKKNFVYTTKSKVCTMCACHCSVDSARTI